MVRSLLRLEEYAHDFKVKKKDVVFDGIVNWLNREGGEIENSVKPTQITAFHGSRKTVSIWKINARKKLIFNLTDIPDGTHVHVEVGMGSMMYFDDVEMMEEQRHVNYGLLMEEIWASVDGVPFTYPGKDEETEPSGTEKKSKWKLFK